MSRVALFVAVLLFCTAEKACGETRGGLIAWGYEYYGICDVPQGDDFVDIVAGRYHNIALKADGSLVGWGQNWFGEIEVPAGSDFVAIAAGWQYSLALKADGSIVAWGNAAAVPGENDFVAISARHGHGLALREDGSLSAWGYNAHDQCDVPAGNEFAAIAAGGLHSLALKTDGSLTSWGAWNASAGEEFYRLISDTPLGNDFVAIAAGLEFNLALRADGSIVGWGNDQFGQITNIPSGNDFVAIACGYDHALALKHDGSVVTWGANVYEVLEVPAGYDFVDVSGGGGHSLALFSTNNPPTADAGPAQTVECSGPLTAVALDATASFDPDGDTLGFEWSLPDGSGASIDYPLSATPTGQFPLGPTLVTLTVTDGNGGFDVTDVLVTVIDTVPPVLVATTDKISLWPPNHEMREVLVSVEITDCAWDTGTVITAWVSSSELDDGTGDGAYVGDVDGQDGYALPIPVGLVFSGEVEPGVYLYEGQVSLRAERDGSESSRVYSIVCDIEDYGGNTSTASCVVVVPHDRRKK